MKFTQEDVRMLRGFAKWDGAGMERELNDLADRIEAVARQEWLSEAKSGQSGSEKTS